MHSTRSVEKMSDMSQSPERERHDSGDEGYSCRICLEKLMQTDAITIPCECRGSLKYVHIKCITSWTKWTGRSKCEICCSNYDVKTEHKYNAFVTFLICIALACINYFERKKLISLMISLIVVTVNTLMSETDWYDDRYLRFILDIPFTVYIGSAFLFYKFVILVYYAWKKLRNNDRIYHFKRTTLKND